LKSVFVTIICFIPIIFLSLLYRCMHVHQTSFIPPPWYPVRELYGT
jgi:hypothetical protein